jgi:hypothetical protein
MTTVKNLKLTSIKQLVDLNGDKVNFELNFTVKSANKTPFDALVVTQKLLDSEKPLEYKRVQEGIINGNIVSDKGLYDNYLLLLKSDIPVDCEVQIDIKDIPLNQEFFRQLEHQRNQQNQSVSNNQPQAYNNQSIPQNNQPIPQNNQPIPQNNSQQSNQIKNNQVKNPQDNPEVENKKPSKINWKLLLFILVICVGCFALWYFYNKNLTKPAAAIPQIDAGNILAPVPEVKIPEIPLIQSLPTTTPVNTPINNNLNNLTQNEIFEALKSTSSESVITNNVPGSNLISKINNLPIW